MSKTKRRRGVLSFDVHTTPEGWRVITMFRTGEGGIEPETYDKPDFQRVLVLLNQLVDTYGVDR